MRRSVRRGLTLAFAGALAATSVTVALTVGTGAANAGPEFYTPPNPLPAGRDGDVIKSEAFTYNNAKATKIMYLSRDTKDRVIPITGTVLVPTAAWTGKGERPIVAYAPFTAGMADKCAVSKVLGGETQSDIVASVQTSFIGSLLGKGFAVAQTDYEGLGTPREHSYVMRRAEAHAVLDVLRAAQRLPGTGLPANGPLGIAGYSEGGGASASAAEMASSYAPELNIKGAYAGAPPADKAVLAKSLDGAYAAGFLGYALVGINQAYPETRLVALANEAGAEAFVKATQTCTMDAVFQFAFMKTSSLTKDGRPVSAYMEVEPFKSVVADLKIGNLKPTMPVLVEHTPMDDIVPYGQGKQMAKDWCAKGANVQFRDMASFSPFFSHALAGFNAGGGASAYLADRFNDTPTTSNCGKF